MFLLEQSCDDGVMLPEEEVYLKVKDCPREMLASFQMVYVIVQITQGKHLVALKKVY